MTVTALIVSVVAVALAGPYNRSRSELRSVQARIGEVGRHAADGLQDQLHRAANDGDFDRADRRLAEASNRPPGFNA